MDWQMAAATRLTTRIMGRTLGPAGANPLISPPLPRSHLQPLPAGQFLPVISQPICDV